MNVIINQDHVLLTLSAVRSTLCINKSRHITEFDNTQDNHDYVTEAVEYYAYHKNGFPSQHHYTILSRFDEILFYATRRNKIYTKERAIIKNDVPDWIESVSVSGDSSNKWVVNRKDVYPEDIAFWVLRAFVAFLDNEAVKCSSCGELFLESMYPGETVCADCEGIVYPFKETRID